jgi:hypothetical protein
MGKMMKVNKAKLKQIILEVLKEEENVLMVRATMEKKVVNKTDAPEEERGGWSRIEQAAEEVGEVEEFVRNTQDAYEAEQKLQQKQDLENDQEST